MGEGFWLAFAIISIVAVVLAACGRFFWLGLAAIALFPVAALIVRIWQ